LTFNSSRPELSRRQFLTAAAASTAAVALSGCSTTTLESAAPIPEAPGIDPTFVHMYRAMPEEDFPIPAVDLRRVDPRFYRRLVDDPTGERPGTIVVDTSAYYLYLVLPDSKAMRYGVGLGRQGFTWSGEGVIQWKRPWPVWTPPAEMIERQPELEQYSAENGGQPPGLDNPLGARALYIFQDGRDTLYRLHGSPEFWTMGRSVSSGCVRLINQDIIDLYDRVSVPSPIFVRDSASAWAA
jgi:lipoprotein-anchoring transpeptidase ErfK/SrfK